MTVRVVYTVECPDWWRRAIRRYHGQDGLATRAECVSWLRSFGSSMDDDLARTDAELEEEER